MERFSELPQFLQDEYNSLDSSFQRGSRPAC